MSLDIDIVLLSRVPLFEGFGKEHLRLLAFGADKRSFRAGSELYRKGAYADGGYVIISGSVDIMSDSSEEAVRLAEFGSASLIGELAMITEKNRSVTAVARDDVEVIKITRQLFRRMLEEYPELASLLHARISSSVQRFVARLERVQRDLDRVDGV
jgi:CRP-like cAMP-binding protein